MNISEKLALTFIEKHFHHFDTEVEPGVILKSTDIQKCDTLTNGVKVFKYCGHELFVYLPESIHPWSASKKSMISKVQHDNISFADIAEVCDYEWCWYRVTQNRLDVLEEIMYNSGMTDAGSLYRFSNDDIVKTDTDNTEIYTFAQDYLTLFDGVKRDDKAYFYANDVQTLCKDIDSLYSKQLRKKTEQLCMVDPKFIENNFKVLEFANEMLHSALKTLSELLGKLTNKLTQK